ncbi:deoxyguanosinetriphosphate triphosphohydrolase [Novosphingobium sp.]|uniref:deoxyguanosinetriphosphate triphosphohydrolase n=1 Tax=Novosphingobium sp. TaxID=1874826 RepID=UPI0022CC1D2A|nr:deoxyguanosinetriphosphate triphosphohydrolase [Novosphingobium sp.]MCZ8019642.1 deoxyguanosinetriphosphate triphosphohydrolase [Novosphingobium sp.]MCZ8035457.1 deoxyguanosinetriphosphate triphosphohydrolase [Novosphingobium sp.]MCZ8050771.1 deoxyguanosinetriphosphate triphosphohydrolase [Novosphingobium sp.]MCZ8059117.1 deoxyguanosinetriphosphate triphosphohydrolase [Novosphingobium sp.]MCZ8232563.1 deoxyguanosinetriphosphate triphosphohydrolase [Novosphingobium sp.]
MRAPYASDPDRSRGREFPLEAALARGPRSAFQRDRDRIVHSIAFRRLRHKTQVFIAPDGDHYRVRLTHSLEVAQIGRVIARALGLDEDLTEALCLAHDIGHPPFGHAGEDALNAALERHGGFDHNAQALRTLMRIESPYCEHDGLNLSWEVLEGMAKHNGPVGMVNWALAELDAAYPLDLTNWPSLEAQVAALADDIAYDNHDIDDGLRAGFLQLDELLTLDFVNDQWRAIERKFPGAPIDRRLRELVRSQIGWMVNDLIAETGERVKGMGGPDEVRGAERATAAFSSELARQERTLKRFMYEKLYHHPQQLQTAERARAVTAELYAAYAQDPSLMADDWAGRLPPHEPHYSRHIADYIAGMTDRFAIAAHAAIYGRTPEGLRNV